MIWSYSLQIKTNGNIKTKNNQEINTKNQTKISYFLLLCELQSSLTKFVPGCQLLTLLTSPRTSRGMERELRKWDPHSFLCLLTQPSGHCFQFRTYWIPMSEKKTLSWGHFAPMCGPFVFEPLSLLSFTDSTEIIASLLARVFHGF